MREGGVFFVWVDTFLAHFKFKFIVGDAGVQTSK